MPFSKQTSHKYSTSTTLTTGRKDTFSVCLSCRRTLPPGVLGMHTCQESYIHTFTTNLVKTWWSTGSYLVTEGIIYRSFLCLCSGTTSVLQCVPSLNNKIISREACQPSVASGISVLSISHMCGRIVVYSVIQPSWNLFTKRNSSSWWGTAFQICLFFNPFVYPLLITAPSGWNLYAVLTLVTSPGANTCGWVRSWAILENILRSFDLQAALLRWGRSCL